MNQVSPFSAQSMLFLTATEETQSDQLTTYIERADISLKGKSHNHADILWLSDEKALGIELIRTLQTWIQEKPYDLDWRAAVILKADTLTIEAQNAALKMLEEPPSYAHLILVTTKPYALLPTVRSRCLVVSLQNNDQKIEKLLALPKTFADAFAFTDELAKDRTTATQHLEHMLVQEKQKLETAPTHQTIFRLQLIQETLHHLKRNVNVRLAVEQFCFQLIAFI